MADEQYIPLSVLRSYSPHPDKLDLTGLTQDEITHGIKSSKLPDYIRYKQYLTDTNEALAQLAEMIIQFAVNLSLDPDQTLDWARKLQQAVPQSEFDSWIATLLDGGPSIFMNTLSELKATYPNGAAGVALVRETDPAKIYVWNGTEWEDFGDYQGIEIKAGSVTSDKISEGAVRSDKTDFIYENVLNPKTTQSLKVFNIDGTLGDSADGYYISDRIATADRDDWVLKRARVSQVIAQYDAQDNLLSFVYGNGTNGSDAPFLYQPRNPDIAYFRVSFSRWLDTPETFWVVRGSLAPTVNVPYGVNIPKLNPAGRLKGKKIAVIGDSITAADGTTPSYANSKITGFQEQLRKLGAEVTSLAIAGATYRKYDASISDSIHASIYTQIITSNGWSLAGYDYIIWFAGTNDVGRGTNFGTIESRDSATTYGALNLLIERAISDNPKAVQILLTPPQRVRTGTTHVPDLWAKLQELAGGFEQIGANYGFKTVNMLKEGGIGLGNISTTLWDTVHQNDLGHELIGKAIARSI